jgi:hypothetical protein
LIILPLHFCNFLRRYELAHAETSCKDNAGRGDLWLTCRSHSWFKFTTVEAFDLDFDLAYFFISLVLLLDISLDAWLKGSNFFKTAFGRYKWNKAIQFILQLSIFARDAVNLSIPQRISGSFVYQPDFALFAVMKLARFWQLNKALPNVYSILSLLKKLYPILKSYFWIVYLFYFIFSILGMALFSFAVTEHGIAIYPNKQQYARISFPQYHFVTI